MRELDKDEKMLEEMISSITVDTDKIKTQVMQKLKDEEGLLKPKRSWLRPGLALVASLMLVITVTAGALGGFDWFIERVKPHFGTIIEPVETYSEDKGIRMEVIGAKKYENKAIIYLSLQDISGQNRITSQTEFLDGFDIKKSEQTGGSFFHEKMLHFDENTNTGYYEFNVTADMDSSLADPLEIHISRIYTDRKIYENEPVDISLAGIGPGETIPFDENQVWGGSGDAFDKASLYTKALKPGHYADMPHGDKNQWISNLGMVDGDLHVQVGQDFNKDFGPSDANIALGKPGEELEVNNFELAFFANENHEFLNRKKYDYSHAKYKYKEIIIPLEEDLKNSKLFFTGALETGIKGEWKVLANLEDANNDMIIIDKDISVENYNFNYISLSPLGMQASGTYQGDEPPADDLKVEVASKDGNIPLTFGGGNINPVKKTFKLHWNAESPLDIDAISAILIGERRIQTKGE